MNTLLKIKETLAEETTLLVGTMVWVVIFDTNREMTLAVPIAMACFLSAAMVIPAHNIA